MTQDQVVSIPVAVVLIIGDHDTLQASYMDPMVRVQNDWPVVEIRDADHITCVAKPQFREEIAAWL